MRKQNSWKKFLNLNRKKYLTKVLKFYIMQWRDNCNYFKLENSLNI